MYLRNSFNVTDCDLHKELLDETVGPTQAQSINTPQLSLITLVSFQSRAGLHQITHYLVEKVGLLLGFYYYNKISRRWRHINETLCDVNAASASP